MYQVNLEEEYKKINETNNFNDLPEQVKTDLIDWIGFEINEDKEAMEELLNLYLNGEFKAWDCPWCGNRVYDGNDYFLIGLPHSSNNNDYVTYPGNTDIYQDEFLKALCDECREETMTK